MTERFSKQLSSSMAIRIEPSILEYSKCMPSTAAKDVFPEAVGNIDELRSLLIDLTDEMVMVIFGSNMIEGVGCDLVQTNQMCRNMFLTERISGPSFRSPEYRQQFEAYIRSDTENEREIQQRREVINHAIAFMFMMDAVVQDGKPFSENLIKEAHSILCSSIPIVTRDGEVIRSNTYAGRYRTRHVHAGNNNFVTPTKVPTAMARFIEELNDI